MGRFVKSPAHFRLKADRAQKLYEISVDYRLGHRSDKVLAIAHEVPPYAVTYVRKHLGVKRVRT